MTVTVLLLIGSLYIASAIISVSAYSDYAGSRKKCVHKRFVCYKLQAASYLLLILQALTAASMKITKHDIDWMKIGLITIIGILVSIIPALIAWQRFEHHKKCSKNIYYPSYTQQRLAYALIIAANILLV